MESSGSRGQVKRGDGNDKDSGKELLTGLSGKDAFISDINSVIGDGEGSGIPVSLAFFDIDNFLHVNEEYGRDAGDRVLQEVGRLMEELFPSDGESVFRAYRNGGDEFAIVMPGIEREQAFLRLEAARAAFFASSELDDITPHPAISIGVATFPDDGETRQEIIRKADDALYRAKCTGRNKVVLAREEKKVPKTSHYTQGQLDRLSALAKKEGVGEAELLREALDDLLKKYSS